MEATLEITEVRTAGGAIARYACRPDTNDGALVAGIIGESEYPFERMQGMIGWALDLGAHIGIVTVALALDNPALRVVAVEALEENCAVLRENVALNGLQNTVTVVCAAVGNGDPAQVRYDYSAVEGEPDGYVHDNRYIGNIYARGESASRWVIGVSIGDLLATYGIERVAFMKTDTEGAEWTYLADPAMSRVERIIGEWHGDPGLRGLRKLLPLHRVKQLDDNPTNGIFEATLR